MATILKQRDIIDTKLMWKALAAQLEDEAPSHVVRKLLLEIIREALKDGREEIKRRFENDNRLGEATVRANAFLIDQILHFAFEVTTTHVYPTA